MLMSTNSQSDHNASDYKDMSFKKARLNMKLTMEEVIEKISKLSNTKENNDSLGLNVKGI